MAKVRVQVTMFADPIEVEEDEIPSLRAQGILVGVAGETAEDGTPPSDTEGRGDGQGSGDGEDSSDIESESAPVGESIPPARKRGTATG